MSTEQQLIQKADIALSDLTSNGGILQPQEFDKFYVKMIEESPIFKEVRTLPLASHTAKINKIGLSGRMFKAANQGAIVTPADSGQAGRALALANRSKATTSQITINTDEVIAEFEIPYEVLEDNIEGDNMTNVILGMIARKANLEFSQKLFLGDTLSSDGFLAQRDGVLKLATSNVVNHASDTVNASLFRKMLKALPEQYKNLKPQMKFLTSSDIEIDYRSTVANRQTALGDAILTGAAPVSVMGVPLVGDGVIPSDKALLTIPKNLIFGIWRNLRIEFEKDIRQRCYYFVITARVGTAIEEEDMVVKATNIAEIA
jgi:HK97 family phage major capsid protein